MLQVVVCNQPGTAVRNTACSVRQQLYPALLALSTIALSITIAVYSIIPEFRNLPGRILLWCQSITFMARSTTHKQYGLRWGKHAGIKRPHIDCRLENYT